MMDLGIAVPTNRYLIHQRDRRWPRVLSSVLLFAAVLLGILLLVGWPRLRATSLHYDLIQLRGEVLELEQRERILALELECERSPLRLTERARGLGLEPPAPPVLWDQAMTGGGP